MAIDPRSLPDPRALAAAALAALTRRAAECDAAEAGTIAALEARKAELLPALRAAHDAGLRPVSARYVGPGVGHPRRRPDPLTRIEEGPAVIATPQEERPAGGVPADPPAAAPATKPRRTHCEQCGGPLNPVNCRCYRCRPGGGGGRGAGPPAARRGDVRPDPPAPAPAPAAGGAGRELAALARACAVLESLDEGGRRRCLDWLAAYYGAESGVRA